jgi:hypothetical protein
MSKPSLLIVTADTCFACKNFKKNVEPSLMNSLMNDNRIQVARVSVKNLGERLPATYPKELNNYIGWYPTLILYFPATKKVSVYNGVVKGNQVEGPLNMPIKEQEILAWLTRELNSEVRMPNRVYKPVSFY